jgi:hypothetical protein
VYCEVDGLPVEIEPLELSAAGVFVETAMPLPVDSEVQVFMRIGEMRFECSGHVVHTVTCEVAKAQRRKPGYGLLFTNVDEATRATLRRGIDSLIASSRPPTAAGLRVGSSPAVAAGRPAGSEPAPKRKPRAEVAVDPKYERKSIAHEPIAPDFNPRERKSIVHEPIAPDFNPRERKSIVHEPIAPDFNPRERKSIVHEPIAPDFNPRERKSSDPAAVVVTPQERAMLEQLRAQQQALGGKTPWEVLGISQGADPEQAKRAFFAASKRYHPHLFARWNDPEIKRIVTELFIAHKRAYTSLERTNKGPR